MENDVLCEAKYLDISYEDMKENYLKNCVEYCNLVIESRFSCTICGKLFNHNRSLSTHKKICSKKILHTKPEIDSYTWSMFDKSKKHSVDTFDF